MSLALAVAALLLLVLLAFGKTILDLSTTKTFIAAGILAVLAYLLDRSGR